LLGLFYSFRTLFLFLLLNKVSELYRITLLHNKIMLKLNGKTAYDNLSKKYFRLIHDIIKYFGILLNNFLIVECFLMEKLLYHFITITLLLKILLIYFFLFDIHIFYTNLSILDGVIRRRLLDVYELNFVLFNVLVRFHLFLKSLGFKESFVSDCIKFLISLLFHLEDIRKVISVFELIKFFL